MSLTSSSGTSFAQPVLGGLPNSVINLFPRRRPPAGRRSRPGGRGPTVGGLTRRSVEEFDADRVALIGGVALAPPVFARGHLQIELLELVLPLGVHALQDVGDPAGAGLADDELEAGVVLEHAREDHRQQNL